MSTNLEGFGTRASPWGGGINPHTDSLDAIGTSNTGHCTVSTGLRGQGCNKSKKEGGRRQHGEVNLFE